MANHGPISAMMHDDFLPVDEQRADEVARILEAFIPRNDNDDTRIVLRAFMDHLPLGGHRNMADDILACEGDFSRLRKLRNFVVDTILKPSKPLSSSPILARRD